MHCFVKALLERHERSPSQFHRMVEYGCGVGRVTPYFARQFSQVTAIDISTSHLALAKTAVEKSGQANVAFVLARGAEFGMQESFDLWFSRIVLQHNPPPIITLILKRMFSLLAEGGVAIFQVPTYAPGYGFDIETYMSAPKLETIEMHCLPQEAVFQLADAAGCVPLEIREDEDMGYPFLSNTFVVRKSRRVAVEVPDQEAGNALG